jgi:pyrroloquinoline quinone biosynthesis protein D
MVTLNGPAGEILKRCDGTLTASQLVETLEQEFPGNDNLEDDVRDFLVDARERGWIRGG